MIVPYHISKEKYLMIQEFRIPIRDYEIGFPAGLIEENENIKDAINRELKEETGLEMETFVHGAMCVSYSGRCLLSNYLTHRDANKGACSHPCRWKYYLMEEKRPGEYMPVFENERGTFIYNSKDLCMIEHIKELIELTQGDRETFIEDFSTSIRELLDKRGYNYVLNGRVKSIYSMPFLFKQSITFFPTP